MQQWLSGHSKTLQPGICTLSSLSVSHPLPLLTPSLFQLLTLTLSSSTYPHSLPIHPLLHLHSFSILTLLHTLTCHTFTFSPSPHCHGCSWGGLWSQKRVRDCKCISVESRDYCNNIHSQTKIVLAVPSTKRTPSSPRLEGSLPHIPVTSCAHAVLMKFYVTTTVNIAKTLKNERKQVNEKS